MKYLVFVLFVLLSPWFAHAETDEDSVRVYVENDAVARLKKVIETGEWSPSAMINAQPYGEKGISLLALAARSGSVKVAQYLIEKGADLDARTSVKETALMLASFFDNSVSGGSGYKEHDQIAEMLIKAGANLECNECPYTPLSYAAYKARKEISLKLLAAGADVDGQMVTTSTKANSPLMMATLQDKREYAKMLLVHGAQVKIKKHTGETAMDLARKYNRTDFMPMFECAWNLKDGEKFADKCL